MPRPKEELLKALKDQLAALKSSTAAYDAGNLWEALWNGGKIEAL